MKKNRNTLHTEDLVGPKFHGAHVLVTGASGFLGANIARALCDHGFRVRAMVRRKPGRILRDQLADVEWVIGDVRNPQTIAPAVAGMDSVIHTAALTRLIPRPRQEAVDVNVEGTRNVCEAAVRAGVRRLVFTSSIATLRPGTPDAPADENSRSSRGGPRSVYYDTKKLAEQVVSGFDRRGLETISLCPGYVIGPFDFRLTTNALILHLARSPLLAVPPGGINFVDVRETALAHVRAIWLGTPGDRYILAGPYATYWEVAAMVKRVEGTEPRGFVLPRWTEYPIALPLAIFNGIMCQVPDKFAVPAVRFGFVGFHLDGGRGDLAFRLVHRPLKESLADTLNWFRIRTCMCQDF